MTAILWPDATRKYSGLSAAKRIFDAVAVGFTPTLTEHAVSDSKRIMLVFDPNAALCADVAPIATVCSATGGSCISGGTNPLASALMPTASEMYRVAIFTYVVSYQS
jgi:hypothetical protein